MKKLTSLLFLALLISSCGQQSGSSISAVKTVASNIVGGYDVTTDNRYSIHTVALINKELQTLCTGVLIEDDLVLTAAHCLKGVKNKDDIQVVLGKTRKDMLGYRPRAIAYNKDYLTFGSYVTRDVGLVRLQNKVPENYKPIDLEDTRMLRLEAKEKVTSIGYGINDTKARTGSLVLRMTSVPIKKYKNGDEFIILNQKDGGVCAGDSGGPTFTVVDGKVVLVGITSNALSSPDGDKPECQYIALLSNPNFFYDWINTTKASL